MIRPKVAVSSCLLGELVRFNGGHSRDRFLTGDLGEYVDWVPVCPEMEAGLGSPRETLHLEKSGNVVRLVGRRSRADVTDRITQVAEERIRSLEVDGYVSKAKSPSCGIHGIPVRDGDHTVQRNARGVFAERIIEAFPLLPIEDEGRLHDAVLREAFVERVFANARLRAFLHGDWRPRDLVAFHARHKMQLLAHSPAAYRTAGRVVARAGTLPRADLSDAYAAAFLNAMSRRITVGRHVNVLHHCLGMVGEGVDPVRRADLLAVIDAYQAREVALSVPVALLLHHARGEAAAYVRDQTYFAPYPSGLGLRNHVPG